jgi:16S rRNA (cytosine1402-N4)-methyltransferase
MTADSCHISVLRDEIVELLKSKDGGLFLDCTLGGGGHSKAILDSNPENELVALDRDERAVTRAASLLREYSGRLTVLRSRFGEAEAAVGERRGKFTGIVADLGLSTDQLRENRGFSFNDNSTLDMRMDESQPVTAAAIVNEIEEGELYRILRRGGVGPEARQVVKAIVRGRPFATTKQFAEAVNECLRGRVKPGKKVSPATVVFQAIRIAVNDEFGELEALLSAAPRLAAKGGRLAVITFHSLEDRLTASTMREWEAGDDAPASWRGARRSASIGTLVTKKAVTPSEEEMERNASSRSARLRVFEFGSTPRHS